MLTQEDLERYRKWMMDQRWSPSTIRHALTFPRYLEKKGLDFEEISYESANEFLIKQYEKGVKEETLNGWIRQINRWFKFKGISPPLKYYPSKNRVKRIYIEDEKVKEILKLSWGDIISTRRNRAILFLLFGTGMRVSELVSLDIEDIHLAEGYVLIRRGKGGKTRTVPLPTSTIKVLEEYLVVRIPSDPHALFTSRRGRLWDVSIRRIVKEAGNRVGVPWLHPHAARHWRAKNLLKEGVMVSTVAEVLGHEDLKTTLGYLRQSMYELKEDLRKKDAFFEKEVKK